MLQLGSAAMMILERLHLFVDVLHSVNANCLYLSLSPHVLLHHYYFRNSGNRSFYASCLPSTITRLEDCNRDRDCATVMAQSTQRDVHLLVVIQQVDIVQIIIIDKHG